MKRDIEIRSPLSGPKSKATIIIDKNKMRIENKNPEFEDNDFFIKNLLERCLNMDHWQHSWYIDIGKAKLKNSAERKKIRKIINEKIAQRESEIQFLKDGRNILSKWKYN